MYSKIYNNNTNEYINIYSNLGKNILNQYLKYIYENTRILTPLKIKGGATKKKINNLNFKSDEKILKSMPPGKSKLNHVSNDIKQRTISLIDSVSKNINHHDFNKILISSKEAQNFFENMIIQTEFSNDTKNHTKYHKLKYDEEIKEKIKTLLGYNQANNNFLMAPDPQFTPLNDKKLAFPDSSSTFYYEKYKYQITIPRSIPLLEINFGPNLCLHENTNKIINPFYFNKKENFFDKDIIDGAKNIIENQKKIIFFAFICQLSNDSEVIKQYKNIINLLSDLLDLLSTFLKFINKKKKNIQNKKTNIQNQIEIIFDICKIILEEMSKTKYPWDKKNIIETCNDLLTSIHDIDNIKEEYNIIAYINKIDKMFLNFIRQEIDKINNLLYHWNNTKTLWLLLYHYYDTLDNIIVLENDFNYQIFCQTWMRGNNFSEANFSIASPHFQIFINIKSPLELCNKLIDIVKNKQKKKEFKQKLHTYLYSYNYMLIHLHDKKQMKYGNKKPAYVDINQFNLNSLLKFHIP